MVDICVSTLRYLPISDDRSPQVVVVCMLCKCFLFAVYSGSGAGSNLLRDITTAFCPLSFSLRVSRSAHMFQTPVCVKSPLTYGLDRFTYLHFWLRFISCLVSFHFSSSSFCFITYYYYIFPPLPSFFPLIILLFFPFLLCACVLPTKPPLIVQTTSRKRL